jgi:hypothetical protein
MGLRPNWNHLTAAAFELTACSTARPVHVAAPAPAPVPSAPPVIATSAPVALALPKEAPPLPSECASFEGKLCLPSPDFAERLCERRYPEVAIHFFSKGSPWTRGYLRRDTEAWNSAQRHARKAHLAFDEEVLVMGYRAPPKNSIIVGQGGGYDVLRLDGTCVPLSMDELGFNRPPAPKHAAIEWGNLEPAIQSALLETPGIEALRLKMEKHCKDSASTRKCQEADDSLTSAIHLSLNAKKPLPAPDRRPPAPEEAPPSSVAHVPR